MLHMEHTIQHQESDNKGAFFIAGPAGENLAEMTYNRTGAALIDIEHTNVGPSLAGQGIGRKLLNELVTWARSNQTKVVPTCAYAKGQFGKDPALGDVLA
jgi:predicted GNAT family acetyltransferase